jgi:predicted metal-dependent HD superfamily phosphohydrolase
MFEDIFKIELERLTSDSLLIDKLWAEIQSNYSKSVRYYHNLTHLDNLIEELISIKDQIEDWQTLTFSVAYHDIIYNTLRQDNEEKSAAFAYDRLTQLNLPSTQKEKCKLQILATKQHQVSTNVDTNYFIDADLSILGSDNRSYLKYAEQIRNEYRYFPDILYKPGRRKVLTGFLKMKSIYKTKYFQDKFEVQAKMNISDELNSLS